MPGANALTMDTTDDADNKFARPGVPHALKVEDTDVFEPDHALPGTIFRPRWQLFLPTIAIAVLYSMAWTWLVLEERGGGALARLFLIVMAIGVPLLAAHAFLRFQTIRVQVLNDAVRYHPGWPRDLPIDMPLALIDKVSVKRGLSGHLFGGGTLVMELTTGEKAAIADLAEPEAAKSEIDAAMAG
ncbi:MAG: PH domain-containing protein [Nitratireductor sp.]